MILKSGKEISCKQKPYIVAELNSSHYGKIEVAKEMIKSAKECGCDGVKFQSWSAESLYCQEHFEKEPISKRIVGRFSLQPEALAELSDYCKGLGIGFSSTPYSNEEVDFLADRCDADYIKVASMDINNLPFLEYIAKKKIPIVLSTGMATMEEIEEAVHCIENTGNTEICILHCVSLYPVEVTGVNLKNILTLKNKFSSYEVGYSDHTLGCEIACASVALGAVLIEKHFTLDNKKVGWDNQMATEPHGMKKLVEQCTNVFLSMGESVRIVSKSELDQRKNMRRSIISHKDMFAGHIITEEDITAKRPGDGIPVNDYKKVVGLRLNRDILKDHMIQWEYLERTDIND